MYIEMKKMGLDVSDLIALVQRKRGGNTGFPYKDFVCCCSNCRYSTKSKCALKECCCMNERICAHTCTFGEMMRYCFSNIGDNVFRFRLRIAIEREAELKSCFLDAGHRKRFYEGLAYTRKASNNLIAQIFLLSAYESLWVEAKKVLERNCVVYSALGLTIKEIDVNPHNLFTTALDLEYGSAHSDLLDLSDDEVVDFDVFRMICYAVAISAYGLDAVKVSEKQRTKKYKHKRKGERTNE
jgi:hypothetical protein